MWKGKQPFFGALKIINTMNQYHLSLSITKHDLHQRVELNWLITSESCCKSPYSSISISMNKNTRMQVYCFFIRQGEPHYLLLVLEEKRQGFVSGKVGCERQL